MAGLDNNSNSKNNKKQAQAQAQRQMVSDRALFQNTTKKCLFVVKQYGAAVSQVLAATTDKQKEAAKANLTEVWQSAVIQMQVYRAASKIMREKRDKLMHDLGVAAIEEWKEENGSVSMSREVKKRMGAFLRCMEQLLEGKDVPIPDLDYSSLSGQWNAQVSHRQLRQYSQGTRKTNTLVDTVEKKPAYYDAQQKEAIRRAKKKSKAQSHQNAMDTSSDNDNDNDEHCDLVQGMDAIKDSYFVGTDSSTNSGSHSTSTGLPDLVGGKGDKGDSQLLVENIQRALQAMDRQRDTLKQHLAVVQQPWRVGALGSEDSTAFVVQGCKSVIESMQQVANICSSASASSSNSSRQWP